MALTKQRTGSFIVNMPYRCTAMATKHSTFQRSRCLIDENQVLAGGDSGSSALLTLAASRADTLC